MNTEERIRVIEILCGGVSYREVGIVQLMAFCNDRTLQIVAKADSLEVALDIVFDKIKTNFKTIESRLFQVKTSKKRQIEKAAQKADSPAKDSEIAKLEAEIERIDRQLYIVRK